MTPREHLLRPTGSRHTVNGPSSSELRLLHWLGYHPEQINGTRQTLIKLMAPGFVFVAPPAEHARYVAMVSS
jgi:hypothetical protein